MKPLVIDTDVASFLFKNDSRAQPFLGRFAVVPSSRDLVPKWAEVMVAARRSGRRLETADAWIAATAALYGAPLVTHNASDYSGVQGLKVITETPLV